MESISKLQVIVVNTLKRSNLSVFTVSDISKLTGFSVEKAYNVLKQLKRKGIVFAIKKGAFLLNESVESNFAYLTKVFSPCYVSLWSALSFYGFTEQVPLKLNLVTTRRQRHSNEVSLHIVSKPLFAGYENAGFPIASKEKMIFDFLWFNAASIDFLSSIVSRNGPFSKKSFNKCLELISSNKKRNELKKKLIAIGVL